jgi:quinol monooxygenase YgiN
LRVAMEGSNTMAKVSMFAKFLCADGKAEEMDAALAAVVAASEGVDGIESYSYHKGEGGTYWFYALMSSAEAMQVHADNEAMQTAMAGFMPLLAGPPEMSVTTPVAVR